MIIQRYNLPIETDLVKPIVRVSQYDSDSRQIVFTINADISSATVVIGDNEIEADVSGNDVSFIVTENLTEEAKETMGEVVIGDRIGTLNFIFAVEQTPLVLDLGGLRTMKYNLPSFFKPRLEPIKIDLKTDLDDKIKLGDEKQVIDKISEETADDTESEETETEIENTEEIIEEEESEVSDDAETGE